MAELSQDEHDRQRQRSYEDSGGGRGQGRTSGRTSPAEEGDFFKLMDAYMQMKLGLPLADNDRAEVWRDRLGLLRDLHEFRDFRGERRNLLEMLRFVSENRDKGDMAQLLQWVRDRREREKEAGDAIRQNAWAGALKALGYIAALAIGALGAMFGIGKHGP